MSFRLWGGALLQRVLLFITAGIVAIALLHVPTGLKRNENPKLPPTFSASQWLQSSASYVRQVSQGDLGVLRAMGVPGYREDQPVAQVIRAQAPRSGALLGIALVCSLLLGTFVGFLASQFSRRWVRAPFLAGSLLLLSFPDILVVFMLRSAVVWGIDTFGITLLSTATFGEVKAQDAIAPALALAVLPVALVARVAAVAFDEVHRQFFVRTAHAKGLHPLRVVVGHVLRNAWIQVADAGPLIVGSLVTGLVVVEYAFYFPGLGRTLGLILERGGQPLAASAVALALLLGAMVTDSLFGAVRLLLDPRLKERSQREMVGGAFRWKDLRLPSPVTFLRALAEGLRDVPYLLGQLVWTLRPGYVLRGIWQNPPLLIGLTGILALVSLALFGGHLADLRVSGATPKYILHNGEVFFPPYKPGLPGYPLGSDMAGRDMLSRLLIGARFTLFFTLAVTPVRFLIALPWGLAAGFWRGPLAGLSRAMGLMFAALPVMLVPVALLPLQVVFFAQKDPTRAIFWTITAILAVVGIPRLAETVRQQVESTLVQPFVEGARATGAGSGRILARHVLPHLGPQLWVAAAADMAWTLLLLAQLGVFSIYLGGAVPAVVGSGDGRGVMIPRMPDWSSMLSKPYEVIYRAPWAIWVPAAAFLLAVIIFNLTAEGLRRRAQRLAARAPLPEPVVGPDGVERIPARAKRRVVVEWVAALLIALVAVGATARWGGAQAPTPPSELTPLALARNALQGTLDTIYGTGDQYERAKAVSTLSSALSRYLGLAYTEKLNGTQIQEDTRGRVNIFSFDAVRVVQFQVPAGVLSENAFHSFIQIQDMKTGQVVPLNVGMKPVYAAAVDETLILAGTVPGPDNWEIHFFQRINSRWVASPEMAVRLADRVPAEYKASVVLGFNQNPRNQVTLKGGPLNSARLEPNGDVSVCLSNAGPCVMVPWADYAPR